MNMSPFSEMLQNARPETDDKELQVSVDDVFFICKSFLPIKTVFILVQNDTYRVAPFLYALNFTKY